MEFLRACFQLNTRGTRLLVWFQSATLGRSSSGGGAAAGGGRRRLGEPPDGPGDGAGVGETAGRGKRGRGRVRLLRLSSARADARANSSQIGWPDGASAACGSAMPNASATTCEVAAVPRN